MVKSISINLKIFTVTSPLLSKSGSMEFGYHVYRTQKRLCLSRCCDRLVQSISTLVPSLEQLGDCFLFGSLRGGNCHLWSTGYRPGCTVYLARIYRSDTQQRHSIQHGRGRALDKECIAYCTFGIRLNTNLFFSFVEPYTQHFSGHFAF